MSADRPRHEIATRRVTYEVATDGVTVNHNIPYELGRNDGLALDIYYPARTPHEPAAPALLFVTGYPDDGLQRVLGCVAKDMESYVSWARLAAANGIVAITYQNRTPEDVHAVLRYMKDHAGALGIDARRIGVWSCSGNLPTAHHLPAGPRAGGGTWWITAWIRTSSTIRTSAETTSRTP